MRDIETERAGIRFSVIVTFPRRVACMKRSGAIHKREKKFTPFRVEDCVDGRVAAGGGNASRDLRLVLEVAAIGKTNREIEPFGLAIEVLVVGIWVNAAENGVLRFALPAVRTEFRADGEHVARARAFLKA